MLVCRAQLWFFYVFFHIFHIFYNLWIFTPINLTMIAALNLVTHNKQHFTGLCCYFGKHACDKHIIWKGDSSETKVVFVYLKLLKVDNLLIPMFFVFCRAIFSIDLNLGSNECHYSLSMTLSQRPYLSQIKPILIVSNHLILYIKQPSQLLSRDSHCKSKNPE